MTSGYVENRAELLTIKPPGNETGRGLSNAPPACQSRNNPLLLSWCELEHNCGIKDQISASPEAEKGDEDAIGNPVRHGTRNDGGNRSDEQRRVEGNAATDHVGTEAPEKSSN